jgi:hypothetical protein
MVLTIVVVAGLILGLSYKGRSRRIGRADRLGLDLYDHKARCDGAFPFDYLSR